METKIKKAGYGKKRVPRKAKKQLNENELLFMKRMNNIVNFGREIQYNMELMFG